MFVRSGNVRRKSFRHVVRSVAGRGEEDEAIRDRELVFVPEPSSKGEREVSPRAVPTENDPAPFAHLGVLVENVDVDRSCVLDDSGERGDLKETVLDGVNFIANPSLWSGASATRR